MYSSYHTPVYRNSVSYTTMNLSFWFSHSLQHDRLRITLLFELGNTLCMCSDVLQPETSDIWNQSCKLEVLKNYIWLRCVQKFMIWFWCKRRKTWNAYVHIMHAGWQRQRVTEIVFFCRIPCCTWEERQIKWRCSPYVHTCNCTEISYVIVCTTKGI